MINDKGEGGFVLDGGFQDLRERGVLLEETFRIF